MSAVNYWLRLTTTSLSTATDSAVELSFAVEQEHWKEMENTGPGIPRLWTLQGCQAFANAIFGEPCNAPDLELVHDLFAVRLYCLNAQVESSRDILC